jgi:large subunit ribosomal protein L9
MQVILNDHVEHLGERGDRVQVKAGYARNFLLPKGLAYTDTVGNARRFDAEQSHWEEMDLKRRGAAEKMAADLGALELIFERRAGEKDVLFGSVSAMDVSRELAERGFEIDKRRVLLAEPLKSIGSFEVDVHVHREITVTLPVYVVRPGEQPVRPGDEPAEETVEAAGSADGVVSAEVAGVDTTAEAVPSE